MIDPRLVAKERELSRMLPKTAMALDELVEDWRARQKKS